MSFDHIENINGAIIHHGPASDRVYLLHCPDNKLPGVHETLLGLAEKRGYGKIVLKIPAEYYPLFQSEGYLNEARIPGFYGGSRDCIFATYYLDPMRQAVSNGHEIRSILEQAELRKVGSATAKTYRADCAIERLTLSDVGNLAALYREVFTTYPFPIHDPEYLVSTMGDHVTYFGAKENDKLVAVSSIEANPSMLNGEMTDFATLPSARGKGLASLLLRAMHEEFGSRGYLTAYTIARAVSPGMNLTFASAGYTFGGTLVNNTQISGQLESMNVWHKQFAPA